MNPPPVLTFNYGRDIVRKHLAEESARYRQVTGAVARIMGFA